MAEKNAGAWNVLPHGPLERLSENLWWAVGSLKGMSLKRVMAVAKRRDGKLVIHSAIAMAEENMRELEALGEPAYLVVPSHHHRIDAPAYKKRYPALRVYAPRGSREKIEHVVPVDGVYEDFPADDAVRLETLHGMKEREGAMIVTSADGTTIVLNDAVFNMDNKSDVLGYLFTTLLGSAPGPRVSRLAKIALVDDRTELRRDLERFASTPDLVRLMVAHEKVAHGPEAKSALEQAATYLR
jgi:hypothetical protein